MSNNYEQPVEPMSRAEDILRGDTANVPQSRVEDLLIQLIEQGGGSSGVIVTPILESGVKIASISVDGALVDIYAPNDTVGSIVSISTIQQTGTKIATLTIDGHDYDIYAPAGGSSNLYGTTAPTSDQGSNGDIYMQYTPEGAPVIDDNYTTGVWSGRAQIDGPSDIYTFSGLDLSECYYLQVYLSDTMDHTESNILVSDIGVQGDNNPYYIPNSYGSAYFEKSADGKTLYASEAGSARTNIWRLDARKFTQAQTAITDIYGKVENKWVNTRSYSETVLWSGTETISAWASPFTIPGVTLSILDNYDAFSFEAELQDGSDYCPYCGIVLASYLKINVGNYVYIPIMISHSKQMTAYFDQTNNNIKMYAETNYGYRFKRLVGIKY